MTFNPFLQALGFAEDDKVVIVHADDVGMCQASVTAFTELYELGRLNSGSVMAPCAWLPAIAHYCRQFPQTDLGLHLTFTSEWEHYRWRPLSTNLQESGLIDKQGYFFSTTAAVQARAIPEFIRAEVFAQFAHAEALGIDVSHIDMHMGAMLHPNFLPAYFALGQTKKIPMLALNMSEKALEKWNNPSLASSIRTSLVQLKENNFPVFDGLYQTDLSKPESRQAEIEQMFAELKPGLHHFILHPSHDTPELRALTPDWAGRCADYNVLLSGEFPNLLQRYGIRTIGFRALRDVIQNNICNTALHLSNSAISGAVV